MTPPGRAVREPPLRRAMRMAGRMYPSPAYTQPHRPRVDVGIDPYRRHP